MSSVSTLSNDKAPGLELTQEIPSLEASKDADSFDDTLNILTRTVAEQGTSQSHRARANFLFSHGITKQALEDYAQAIAKDPHIRKNFYNRAIIYIHLNQYAQAIPDLQQALELDAEHINSLIHLAGAYEKTQDYQMALITLEKLCSLDPRPEAYNRMASICFRLGCPEEALEFYGLAIRMNGDNYLYYNNRGIVQFRLKDYAKALEDFSQSIFYKPDFLSAYKNRASCYAKLMQLPLAIEDYSFVLQRQPENTSLLFKRASLYEISQQPLLAEQDLAELIALQPDFFEAQEKLNKLKQQNSKNEPHLDTKQSLELNPSLDTQLFDTRPIGLQDPPEDAFLQDIVYTSAKQAQLRKDFTTAIELYDKALQDYPNTPEIHYQKAQCLISLGQVREAIEEFTSSGKLGLMDGFVSALQNLAHKPNLQERQKISEIYTLASSFSQSSSQKLLLTYFWLYSQKYEIVKPKDYLLIKSEFQAEFIQQLTVYAYSELHNFAQETQDNQEQNQARIQDALKILLDVKYIILRAKVQQASHDKLDILNSIGYCYLLLAKPDAAIAFLQESHEHDSLRLSSLNLLVLAHLSEENFYEILDLTTSFWQGFQQKLKKTARTQLDPEQKNILLCRAIACLVGINSPYKILKIFTNQNLQKDYAFAYLSPQDIDFIALYVCKSLFKTTQQQGEDLSLTGENRLEALEEKIALLKQRLAPKHKLFWLSGIVFTLSSVVFTDVFFNKAIILKSFVATIPLTGLEYISSSSFAVFFAVFILATKSFLGATRQVQHAEHFQRFINNRLLDNNLQNYLASYLHKLYNNFSLPEISQKVLSKNKILSLKAHIFLDKL